MAYKYSQFHLRWTLIIPANFHSQINFHMYVNSLSWKETLFGRPFLCSFCVFVCLLLSFPKWFSRKFGLACYSFFEVPFFVSSSRSKMASKSLSLILSKIDICNTKWRNLCVLNKSTTGVKFSWILHKRFL